MTDAEPSSSKSDARRARYEAEESSLKWRGKSIADLTDDELKGAFVYTCRISAALRDELQRRHLF